MVRLRAMTEGDLAAVMAIAAGLATAPQWGLEVYAKAIQPGSLPRRIALVAEIDGELAGFAVAQMVQDEAELETVGVAGMAQGEGVGRELLGALLGAAKAAGAGEMTLEVRASNARAMGLYARLGFSERGRRPRYYEHPVEDAVVMGIGL